VTTAVGPGSGLQVTPRDRSGGRDDDGDRRSTGTYPAVDNRLIRVLVEGLRSIEARQAEEAARRARLHIVMPEAKTKPAAPVK